MERREEQYVADGISVLSWDEIVDCIEKDTKPRNQIEVEDIVIDVSGNIKLDQSTENDDMVGTPNQSFMTEVQESVDQYPDENKGTVTSTDESGRAKDVSETQETMHPRLKPWEKTT